MYITGSNLPFVWFFTESGSFKSGLSPLIQHLFKNGIEIFTVSGSAISGLGGGMYRFIFNGSNVDQVGDYEAVAFITGTADVDTLPCRIDVENVLISLDDTIEGTLTLRKIIKLIASALFGKSFGGGTANVGFRDTQDTKNRISATVDANGNRTNVTLDGS